MRLNCLRGWLRIEMNCIDCFPLLWRAFCGERDPSLCRRHDGTSLPKSLRQTTRPGPLLLTVNVVWGFFNAMVGYLLSLTSALSIRAIAIHILAFGLGALLISIFSARHFGQFHGGNTPSRT